MPATKELPNLKLVHHMPPLGEVGDVIPGHCVPDPDALERLGGVQWTGDKPTKNHPPYQKPSAATRAELVSDLATARAHAETVAEAKLKLEDEKAKADAKVAEMENQIAELKEQLAKKPK